MTSPELRLRHPLRWSALRETLRGHDKTVRCVAALADGRIVSGSFDDTIRVWDIDAKAELSRIPTPSSVWSLVTTDDDRIVAALYGERCLRVWDANSGLELAQLHGHEADVRVVTRLVDGRIVSGGKDRSVRVWDLDAGRELARFDGSKFEVQSIVGLTDDRLASCAVDPEIWVWAAASGKPIARIESPAGYVIRLVGLADGRLLFWAREGLWSTPTIWAWDGSDVTPIDAEDVFDLPLEPDPSGRGVSVASAGASVQWDLVARFEDYEREVKSAASLPDGRLVTGDDRGVVRIWEVPISEAQRQRHAGHCAAVTGLVALSGGRVASSSRDGSVAVWEVESGRMLRHFRAGYRSILCVAALPDGRVVTGNWDENIGVWDPETGALLDRLSCRHYQVRSIAVLADGRFVTGAYPKGLRLWDIDAELDDAAYEEADIVDPCAVRWFPKPGVGTPLTVLRDGAEELLVCHASEYSLALWDPADETVRARFVGHRSDVLAAVVSDDGRLVSGSHDRTVRVWDIASARELACLEGHSNTVEAVATLGKGDALRVVSASDDQTVRLWHPDGACLAVLHGDASFRELTVVDDHIIAGDDQGRLWFLDIELPR